MSDERLAPGTRLVVASHNPGKVWEIKQLIAPYGLDAVSASDLKLDEPEETETTFAGNARIKAQAAAKGAGLPALADDSGLEIDVLGGAPGVFSARWAGPEKDFTVAMRKVAEEIAERDGWTVPGPVARFRCVLCLAWPDGANEIFDGRVEGHVVWPARGGNGFGYDPMFVAEGETQTFGEMEPEQKYAMSHRTRAFAAFKANCLGERIDENPVSDDAGEALRAAACNLSSKEELVQFIAQLRADLSQNGKRWENTSLEDFLEAMQAWLADSDLAEEPRWRTLAKALHAASMYE